MPLGFLKAMETWMMSWNAEERFGLELEERLQRQLIGSPNQVEAITANFENREPNFRDPE